MAASRGHFLTACVFSAASTTFSQAIPEPPLVWYGQVRNNAGGTDVRLTLGTLSWTITPSGGGSPIILTAQLTNLNDQFSYVLFVPSESELAGVAASSQVLKLTTPNITYSRTNVTWNGQPLHFKEPSLAAFTFSPAARGKLERIDLGMAQFAPDSDGDGLPDSWENAYPRAGDPAGDFDGDGLTNYREYVAGTDPENASSSFEFIRVEPQGPGLVRVQWSSIAGKTYTILRAPILSGNPLDYIVIQSGIAATAPINTFQDTTPGVGPWFYRLRVQE